MAAALGVLLLTGCGRQQDTADDLADADSVGGDAEVYTLATTFYPTTYIAERLLAGVPGVAVVCPTPSDADPAHWRPSADEIGTFQDAELILLNGAGLEGWSSGAALPRSRVIDSSASFSADLIAVEGRTHSHGPDGDHTHEGVDPHTWLDPMNAIAQAEALADRLQQNHADHAERIRANMQVLRTEFEDLRHRAEALTPRLENTLLVTSHPSYNYLARRAGWTVVNRDIDPEQAIPPAALAELEALRTASTQEHAILLWESTPLPETEAALQDIGFTTVVFSPGESLDTARKTAGEDFRSIMTQNFDRLEAAAQP